MSVLANHPFTKMNGLGNEIVVVDMRRQAGTISAQDARAAAAPNGVPYDQLMALHAPRTPGTDAYLRIYNNDGSEAGACGNGMRCVAELLFKETGKSVLTLETTAGLLSCWKDERPSISTVDMGKPRFAWNEIPLAKKFEDTRVIALGTRPMDEPTLGMTVYWMLYYTAFMRGLWWWILAPIVMLVVLFVALYLISQGLDAFANPRLRQRTS